MAKKKQEKHDYHVEYPDITSTASANDTTGLMPRPPQSEDELSSYMDLSGMEIGDVETDSISIEDTDAGEGTNDEVAHDGAYDDIDADGIESTTEPRGVDFGRIGMNDMEIGDLAMPYMGMPGAGMFGAVVPTIPTPDFDAFHHNPDIPRSLINDVIPTGISKSAPIGDDMEIEPGTRFLHTHR